MRAAVPVDKINQILALLQVRGVAAVQEVNPEYRAVLARLILAAAVEARIVAALEQAVPAS